MCAVREVFTELRSLILKFDTRQLLLSDFYFEEDIVQHHFLWSEFNPEEGGVS